MNIKKFSLACQKEENTSFCLLFDVPMDVISSCQYHYAYKHANNVTEDAPMSVFGHKTLIRSIKIDLKARKPLSLSFFPNCHKSRNRG